MIIGFMGKAGSGKDTAADYLMGESGWDRIALADPIKRIVKDAFALDHDTVYDRHLREQPLENWPDWTVRKLCQYVGTELFRTNIDPDIWVKSLHYKIKMEPPTKNWAITDIRFPNELRYFKSNCEGFVSISVSRDGCDGNVGISGHESEAYDLRGDYHIENNGTIEEFYHKLKVVLEKLY